MVDYVMSVRAVKAGQFTAQPGNSTFLEVPDGADPDPSQKLMAAAWFKKVRAAAMWSNDAGEARGDVLFIVHGYNMDETEVMDRHRRLRDDLAYWGYKGAVVSFDWPSGNQALAYLPDRLNAKLTAFQLVADGIDYLSKQQSASCAINVHVLGHSTGAYVVREAFDHADDTQFDNMSWMVSQLIFAAGDVSADSLADPAISLYRHCVRLTNYSSRMDAALDLSNVKRVGLAPRAGRIGLPAGVPDKAVNVDCTGYYQQLTANDSPFLSTDQPHDPPFAGLQSHSWYFGNRLFARDLFYTLIGIDRQNMPTRARQGDALILQHV